MLALRHTEVIVLGYRIDHVRAQSVAPNLGRVERRQTDREPMADLDDWREVLCPTTGNVLARFSSRAEAERYIVDRELASAQSAVRRNAA